jgi:hypothetical protein
MALMHKSAAILSSRLPKVLGPRTHAVIDYSVAGLFLGAGLLFWGRHKRAAISALLCGAGTLLNALFTDYPGGVVGGISFETHGSIDAGLAGLAATIPGLMGFDRDAQTRFFEASAVAGTLAAGFTDYSGTEQHEEARVAERTVA